MSTIETTKAENMSREWLKLHPEVAAAAPAWADAIDADSDTFGAVSLSYDRDFGAVEIGSAATWRDGTVTQRDPGVYVYFSANEAQVTPESLRAYAAQFLAAADAMDDAERR